MTIQINRALSLAKTLRKYHSDFPPNALAVFCALAREEGLSTSDIVNKLDLPKATVSRNMRFLSDRLSPDKKGLSFIRMEHDPSDYRIRRGYLTDTGKKFLLDFENSLR
jgi:DNA-binding MarR family transcriptional regulator